MQLIYNKYDEVGIVLFGTEGIYSNLYDDAFCCYDTSEKMCVNVAVMMFNLFGVGIMFLVSVFPR